MKTSAQKTKKIEVIYWICPRCGGRRVQLDNETWKECSNCGQIMIKTEWNRKR